MRFDTMVKSRTFTNAKYRHVHMFIWKRLRYAIASIVCCACTATDMVARYAYH